MGRIGVALSTLHPLRETRPCTRLLNNDVRHKDTQYSAVKALSVSKSVLLLASLVDVINLFIDALLLKIASVLQLLRSPQRRSSLLDLFMQHDTITKY